MVKITTDNNQLSLYLIFVVVIFLICGVWGHTGGRSRGGQGGEDPGGAGYRLRRVPGLDLGMMMMALQDKLVPEGLQ